MEARGWEVLDVEGVSGGKGAAAVAVVQLAEQPPHTALHRRPKRAGGARPRPRSRRPFHPQRLPEWTSGLAYLDVYFLNRKAHIT